MKKKLAVAAITTSILMPSASADHLGRSRSYYEPSMYFFGGLGANEYSYDQQDFRYSFGDGSLSNIKQDNESATFRFGLGFGVGQNWSLEMGYADLGDFSATAISSGSGSVNNGYSPGRVDMDADISGGFLGVRVHTPNSEPVGLYARAGIYGWEAEGSVQNGGDIGHFLIEGTDPYVGFGLRLAVDRNINIELGYDHYILDDANSFKASANTLSADIVFRF